VTSYNFLSLSQDRLQLARLVTLDYQGAEHIIRQILPEHRFQFCFLSLCLLKLFLVHVTLKFFLLFHFVHHGDKMLLTLCISGLVILGAGTLFTQDCLVFQVLNQGFFTVHLLGAYAEFCLVLL